MPLTKKPIGEILVDNGQITPDELALATRESKHTGEPMSVVLARLGLAYEHHLKNALELQYGVTYVALARLRPEYDIISAVPEALMRRHMLVPVSRKGNRVTVAMVDPNYSEGLEVIKQFFDDAQLMPAVCTEDEFIQFMEGPLKELLVPPKKEEPIESTAKAPLAAEKKETAPAKQDTGERPRPTSLKDLLNEAMQDERTFTAQKIPDEERAVSARTSPGIDKNSGPQRSADDERSASASPDIEKSPSPQGSAGDEGILMREKIGEDAAAASAVRSRKREPRPTDTGETLPVVVPPEKLHAKPAEPLKEESKSAEESEKPSFNGGVKEAERDGGAVNETLERTLESKAEPTELKKETKVGPEKEKPALAEVAKDSEKSPESKTHKEIEKEKANDKANDTGEDFQAFNDGGQSKTENETTGDRLKRLPEASSPPPHESTGEYKTLNEPGKGIAVDTFPECVPEPSERSIPAAHGDKRVESLAKESEDAAVVMLCNQILANAIAKGATTVHIQALERQVLVHYRMNGQMMVVRKLPRILFGALQGRFRKMGRVEGQDGRLPQDGRIKVRMSGRDFSLRLSIIPGPQSDHITVWIE